MSGKKNLKITIIGIGIALNIIGGFIAVNLKLPVYLDSVGTAIIAVVFGPVAGIATGLLGSFISGITFDIYSLYYMPVQIFTGGMIGYFASKDMLKGYKKILSVFLVAIVISTIGALITIEVFDGLTSAGSSYILMFLRNFGMNDVFAAFIVQLVTDYFDELIACTIAILVVSRLPKNIKMKIEN